MFATSAIAQADIKAADHAIAADQPVPQRDLLFEVGLLEIEVLHVEELAVEIAVADEGLQIQSRVSVVLSSVHDVSF